MDMDFAKIMQMMNGGGGGNKDMSMLMQMLPQLMNNSSGDAKPSDAARPDQFESRRG